MADNRAPRWLKPANSIYKALLRRGLVIGKERAVVLTVTGRTSGKPRSTPVTPMHIAGNRYVVAVYPGADWVRNVRADEAATVTEGRRSERVRLVELRPELAGPVLRLFPTQLPTGVAFVQRAGLVSDGSPDEFEALAGRLPVFRVDPV
ncbi:MAG TPA: nitroreductase family deazaflavin-dependent oxidoreductase [Mycobacterium sp.]|nr:nitroreductase family deazaflavin-dependent oxidoreductase [Mycobacterium sp.]